jgi:hypothetical protein
MEYVADVLDFTHGAQQHCGADASNGRSELGLRSRRLAQILPAFATIKPRAEAIQ